MIISPLNLVSSPVPVLNSLGLDLKIGLSSEDPMGHPVHANQAYRVFLSIYSPEGTLANRIDIGEIPPNQRRLFDVTGITREYFPTTDHLTVVHRVPTRLMRLISDLDDPLEIEDELNYNMFRSLVEYSYPEGGNGSVIYETPPRFNEVTTERRSSNTLTFSCQAVVSESVNTHVVLIHSSVSPQYSRIADYQFALYSPTGERVVTDHVRVTPFGIRTLDVAGLTRHLHDHPGDGLHNYSFVGISDNAALLVFLINVAPDLGAVSVEHTHPSQEYLLPMDKTRQRGLKTAAQSTWKSIFSTGRG